MIKFYYNKKIVNINKMIVRPMRIKKLFFKMLTILNLSIMLYSNLPAACCGDVQRGEGPYMCPNPSCSWQRSDRRCNDSSECCPGYYCSGFGYCEPCR